MNLFLRIFLIIALLWSGAVIYHIGVDNITISNVMYMVVAPVALLGVCCVGARHALRGLTLEEKKPEAPSSKIKPKSAMELYELEKARKEQEEALREMTSLLEKETHRGNEATFQALQQKKKAAAAKKTGS